MRLRLAILLALGTVSSGCASFYPVDTTPEGIRGTIAPGDTVRLTTSDRSEHRLLVVGIDDRQMWGRPDDSGGREERVSFDQIDELEIQRLNMRKALLTVVLPVVAGAIIACQHESCRTHGAVDVQY